MEEKPKQDMMQTLMPIIIVLFIVGFITLTTQNLGVGVIIGCLSFIYLDLVKRMKALGVKLDGIRKEKEESSKQK